MTEIVLALCSDPSNFMLIEGDWKLYVSLINKTLRAYELLLNPCSFLDKVFDNLESIGEKLTGMLSSEIISTYLLHISQICRKAKEDSGWAKI